MEQFACIERFTGARAVALYEPLIADGICGREATHFVFDFIDATWGPRCTRCARFYAQEIVRQRKPAFVTYHPRTRELEVDGSFVDLQRIRTSAEALDWIAHLARKARTSDETLGRFVRELDELLGLQQNYCGDGKSKTANPTAILQRRALRGAR